MYASWIPKIHGRSAAPGQYLKQAQTGITVRQMLTPDHLQARVNTAGRMIAGGGLPVGALLTGLLAEVLPIRLTFGLLTISAMVGAGLAGWSCLGSRPLSAVSVAAPAAWPEWPGPADMAWMPRSCRCYDVVAASMLYHQTAGSYQHAGSPGAHEHHGQGPGARHQRAGDQRDGRIGVPARDAQAATAGGVRDTQLTGTFFYDRGTVLGRLA